MCGRMNVSDSPFVKDLMSSLGLAVYPRVQANIAPGGQTAIVIEHNGQRRLQEALWSLLIEAKKDGKDYRPAAKWRTFNAKSSRLQDSPLWSSAFRSSRTIIPASCFFEWKDKVCYAVTPLDSAIAFAGLYRYWRFGEEELYSFSIITLPGQSGFRHIHEKSYPLMLEKTDYDLWLDEEVKQNKVFAELLNSGIRREMVITPVDAPQSMKAIGESEMIMAMKS